MWVALLLEKSLSRDGHAGSIPNDSTNVCVDKWKDMVKLWSFCEDKCFWSMITQVYIVSTHTLKQNMFLYSTHCKFSFNKENESTQISMFFLGMSLHFCSFHDARLVLRKFNPWLKFHVGYSVPKVPLAWYENGTPKKSWTAAGHIINLGLIWVWCVYIQLHIMTFHCTQAYEMTRLPRNIPPKTSSCLFTGRSRPRAAPGL